MVWTKKTYNAEMKRDRAKMKAKMEEPARLSVDYINVIEIRNGVVDSNRLFINDTTGAEKLFKKLVKENAKISKDELENSLDDGYFEVPGGGWTICLSHAEVQS